MKEQRESVAGLVSGFFFAGQTDFSGIPPFTNQKYFKNIALVGCSFASGEDRKKLAGKVQSLDGPLQVMDFFVKHIRPWYLYDA